MPKRKFKLPPEVRKYKRDAQARWRAKQKRLSSKVTKPSEEEVKEKNAV